MNNARINNEIDLTYPDGFAEMTGEQLARYFGSPDNRWGAFDDANHIILSVAWKKAGFFGFLNDAESMMIGAEARMKRNLVNYQRVNSYKMKIADKKKAFGIRFEYRVNDSVMLHVGDLVIFKHKKKFYSVYYITRKINAAASLPAFEEVLKSITAN